jgi:hypothetical protein
MLLVSELGHDFQTLLELFQKARVGKRRVTAFAQLAIHFHAGGGETLSLELNLREQGKIKVEQRVEEIKKNGLKSHQPFALQLVALARIMHQFSTTATKSSVLPVRSASGCPDHDREELQE